MGIPEHYVLPVCESDYDDSFLMKVNARIVVDKFDFEQRFRAAAKIQDITFYELAKLLGATQANLAMRIRTGKFTFEEQRKMADALGCGLVIKNVFPDGTEIIGETKIQLIQDSCDHAGITPNNLADAMQITRQELFKKLEHGRAAAREMDMMASKIGCEYCNYFELGNGIRI